MSQPSLIDTHCHLFMPPLARDIAGVCERARQAGVTDIIVPTTDLDSWSAVRDLVNHDGVHPAFGLHPRSTGKVMIDGAPDPTRLVELKERLATQLRECRAVAIGEVGMDDRAEEAPLRAQHAVLHAQLELAMDFDLPVILHCRNGWELLVSALQPYAGRIRGLMHDYTRHPGLMTPFLKIGFHIGFGGAITRPHKKLSRLSAEELPLDRIVLETAAPQSGLETVAPEEMEPRHVGEVAAELAKIRGMSLEEVADATTANARRFFGI
ncbi:MAG: TatD family hydrolase [bacterium]